MINKVKVLVIESKRGDSTLTQYLLSSIENFDFQVITYNKFNNIIDKIDKFTVILVNLTPNTPRKLANFKQIKAAICDIPILLISDAIDHDLALKLIKEGVQDLLFKSELTSHLLSRAIYYAIEREKVKQSASRLNAIVEQASDAILSVSVQGIILSWNKAAEKIYFYRAQEMIGQSITVLFPKDRQEEGEKLIQQIAVDADINQYETVLKGKHNRLLDVALTISPLNVKANKVLSASIIIRDITKTKLYEQQLAIQYKITLALAKASNLHGSSHSLLKTICEIFDWQLGELWVLDQCKARLYSLSFWSSKEYYQELEKVNHNQHYNKGEGLPGLIWQLKKPYWILDLKTNSLAKDLAPFVKKGLQSFFGFPITYNQEVIGAVIFFSKFLKVPNVNLTAIFSKIGDHIGVFIKRKRAQNELLYLARHDVLTGLGNRVSLENNLNQAILNAQTEQTILSLFYLDLDNFKRINDTLGHDYGDLLLKEVAARIRNNVRNLDFIARVGGDEFIIILPNINNKKDLTVIAQNLLTVLAKPFSLNNKKTYITVSIGIAIYPKNSNNAKKLIKNADTAMYYAKIHGRNRYQFYVSTISAFKQQKLTLESNLHRAIEKQEFILYYQPQVAVKTGKLSGLEALIRWHHNHNKIVYPKEFLSLAEESSLMIPIGEWVLHTACYQIKSWQEDGLYKALNVAVNVSMQQLNFHFIERLKAILTSTKLNPAYLEIEITENTLMSVYEDNLSILKKLKELGVKLSIDDFGTGSLSLSSLKDLMVDIIKIDQIFINQLTSDKNCQAIVKAIIAMSKSLNVKAIAKGVETKEQLNLLKKFGCNYYQGYLFSKPVSVEKIYTMLQEDC
ncbi:EAL domain-containing protein [Legionella sp. D16C41]|uniref:EAL domain-containing protein n=1 Tax=Legionella sp. D16C41 TaxID=3402688 RepID=UPI003AF599EF